MINHQIGHANYNDNRNIVVAYYMYLIFKKNDDNINWGEGGWVVSGDHIARDILKIGDNCPPIQFSFLSIRHYDSGVIDSDLFDQRIGFIPKFCMAE